MLLKVTALASILSGTLYAALPATDVATDAIVATPDAAEARLIDVALEREHPVPAAALLFEEVNVDGLMGAPVIDAQDRFVGNVGQLMVDEKGRIQGLVLLLQPGLPSAFKEVAVETGEVAVLRAPEGSYVVQTEASRGALNAQPAFVPEYERSDEMASAG